MPSCTGASTRTCEFVFFMTPCHQILLMATSSKHQFEWIYRHLEAMQYLVWNHYGKLSGDIGFIFQQVNGRKFIVISRRMYNLLPDTIYTCTYIYGWM